MEGWCMNLHITKSKNAESFYICRSYAKDNGSTTSTIVRKLGTLENLLIEHEPTRDDVIAWAKNEVKAETEKYKKEKEAKTLLIPFHTDRPLDYDKQVFFRGGYLFPQSVYYQLLMNKVYRKLKAPHSKDYLRNKRTIIGALEQFDDFGRMPDGRSRHTLFERGSYHLLCSEFRELIDFYRIYEKKRGKKESTIRGEALNTASFLHQMQ